MMRVDKAAFAEAVRFEREAAYGHRYSPLRDVGVCVYCRSKDIGPTGDHVPPLCAAYLFEDHYPFVIYPACGLCNAVLSVFPAVCLAERRNELAMRLNNAGAEEHLQRVMWFLFSERENMFCECVVCYGRRARAQRRDAYLQTVVVP